MKETKIHWLQYIAIAAGGIILIAATSVATIFGYDAWIKRNGWCVHGYPDGKQRILYGDDCKNLPGVSLRS